MLLADLAAASADVGATRSRLAKAARIASVLRGAGTEVPLAVAYLIGEPRQRRVGVGWAALRQRPEPGAAPTLTLTDVDAAFDRMERAAGAGSMAARQAELAALLGRATAAEQSFLVALLSGELRQGALAGVMADALARAGGLPATEVRRAAMLAGDLTAVAAAALAGDRTALGRFHLEVGRPVQPMLAQTATSVDAALERTGPAAVEAKLDGVRVQIHRAGDDVSVYTRSLDAITDRVPEVVQAAIALPASAVVLDGEAIALRPDGRPRPFQETASRMASRADVERLSSRVPLTVYLFDCLHVDGADLLDRPLRERTGALAALAPDLLPEPRADTADPAVAAQVLHDALARGHEGVVVKALDSPYEAGRRGAAWIKVKPRVTLDLVVLAAEWGHGRRQGWLSNLHLGARDPAGGFVMLGKTFKGLTDRLLEWQTAELLARETHRDRWTVFVRPELVVEVAFDGIQTSPRYRGGMALRFARVLRYRDDKTAADADTVAMVRALHEGGLAAGAGTP